jgi:hypothetical protein
LVVRIETNRTLVESVLNATHASLIEDESDAADASQAILDAGESVRTGKPPAGA